MSWRAPVALAHVGFALVCGFVLGGGTTILALFAAWWFCWFVFVRFDTWAAGRRRELGRRARST